MVLYPHVDTHLEELKVKKPVGEVLHFVELVADRRHELVERPRYESRSAYWKAYTLDALLGTSKLCEGVLSCKLVVEGWKVVHCVVRRDVDFGVCRLKGEPCGIQVCAHGVGCSIGPTEPSNNEDVVSPEDRGDVRERRHGCANDGKCGDGEELIAVDASLVNSAFVVDDVEDATGGAVDKPRSATIQGLDGSNVCFSEEVWSVRSFVVCEVPIVLGKRALEDVDKDLPVDLPKGVAAVEGQDCERVLLQRVLRNVGCHLPL
jgi:hypothetical protein